MNAAIAKAIARLNHTTPDSVFCNQCTKTFLLQFYRPMQTRKAVLENQIKYLFIIDKISGHETKCLKSIKIILNPEKMYSGFRTSA